MWSRRIALRFNGLAVSIVASTRQKSPALCEDHEQKRSINSSGLSHQRMLSKLADGEKRNQHIRNSFPLRSTDVNTGRPLFTFGIVADIQHADIDDATNFLGFEFRYYRGALNTTREAVEYWKNKDISFVAQLGDVIDAQNAGKFGAGLKFQEPQSWVALEKVFDELNKLDCSIPYVHAIGNHELSNFSLDDLSLVLGLPGSISSECVPSPSPFYYSFSPFPGWRIVMLNGYEASVALPRGTKGYLEAEKCLRENHPNAEAILSGQGKFDFFEGLSGMSERFVPFSGAFGKEQLQWLSRTLATARKRDERVILLSHVPLHPMSDTPVSARNLAFDSPEALRIVWEDGGGCVVACLAGHAHGGGYWSEPSVADHVNLLAPLPGEPPNAAPVRAGLHHVILEAILTHKHAYGHIEVYPDRLELVGAAPVGMREAEARKAGFIPSRTLPLEPLSPHSKM